MKNFINQFSQENRFSFYAPFFRVFIGLYLLKDIIITWNFNGLLYKGDSFLHPDPAAILDYFNLDTGVMREYFEIFMFSYILVILLFLFGIGKRYTAILLFIHLELIQNFAWLTLNGGDNLMKFVVLYYIFIDSYNRFSIKPLQFKNEEAKKFSNFISNLAGYSLCAHFCLVYFVSAVHKIHADVWFNGVATYYVLGSERFQGTSWNSILVQSGVFVTLSTYGTILIELIYPFLIWFKKTKYPMMVCSILLHSG
ncbi:hypothetical protein [Aquimarina hainanensis]